ncbi:hypothetical protein L2E82_50125 [Cichorium intybus]|nr:hypothetical protein L2E82_50125 [Cichorium intybus]
MLSVSILTIFTIFRFPVRVRVGPVPAGSVPLLIPSPNYVANPNTENLESQNLFSTPTPCFVLLLRVHASSLSVCVHRLKELRPTLCCSLYLKAIVQARKQVMDATERLGGQFSPHLHPKCTHLVVQISFSIFNQMIISSHECKTEYALKHGLFIITLGWFVDSITFIRREKKKRSGSMFSGQTVYVDPDVSAELRNKVVEAAREEGALMVNEWSVGQNATRVVCEGSSVGKYLGHSNNLVTPLWVLKTVKEARSQRLVHLSADLARCVGMTLGGNDRKV